MELFINSLTIALYLITALTIQLYNRSGTDKKISLIAIKVIWLSALITHGLAIMPMIFIDGQWNLTFFNATSATALLIALTLFFSCLHQRLEILAIFILPFAALMAIVGFGFGEKAILTGAELDFGVQNTYCVFIICI